MDLDSIADDELAPLRAAGLFREARPVLDSPPGPRVRLADGREVLCFCGNDYLGLAAHPRVTAAAGAAAARYGAGAGASRLVCGDLAIHRDLEARLCAFLGRASATVFPTGFLTNLGVVGALVGRGDVVCSDARNHASLVDACRLARAETHVYPHADPAALDAWLSRERRRFRRCLVVTDAVFSMTGAIASLPDLLAVAARHDAILAVDEAHAIGVLGATGRGIAEHFGLPPDAVPVSIVTFGKALGGQGGAAVGGAALADLLRNRARAHIFSTALAPPAAGAVAEALAILDAEPGRVAGLRARAVEARAALHTTGIQVPPGETPILYAVLGDPVRTVAVSDRLLRSGVLVGPIRPPTVPPGEAGLRVTVAVGHSGADVRRLAATLAEALAAPDVKPGSRATVGTGAGRTAP